MRRTIAHPTTEALGWSSVAIHLEPSEQSRGGFVLTLFYDTGRAPAAVFLQPKQLDKLCEMAASSAHSDQDVWDTLGKVPLEPLAPSRGLSARLRALLVDHATAIRNEVRGVLERHPPAPPSEPVSEPAAEPAAVAAVTNTTDPAKLF
jgi:hypothetical protein